MPELPEVETTRRGVSPYLEGKQIAAIKLHCRKLRWPVPAQLPNCMYDARVTNVLRRAKYLIIETDAGTLISHLGMSGSWRVITAASDLRKHDHVELIMRDGARLVYHDPRRFGALLYTDQDWRKHPQIVSLGPEPFDSKFSPDYLFQSSRKRRVPIKTLIMDNAIVVGVGNIYANEALFIAGIRPRRAAKSITKAKAARLYEAIVCVLKDAIDQGGTTLKDFINTDGQPGYFAQTLKVYGREGEQCGECGSVLKGITIASRATVYCPKCQC